MDRPSCLGLQQVKLHELLCYGVLLLIAACCRLMQLPCLADASASQEHTSPADLRVLGCPG